VSRTVGRRTANSRLADAGFVRELEDAVERALVVGVVADQRGERRLEASHYTVFAD
jgi:hypothetical protein